jgi:hypothetical protein
MYKKKGYILFPSIRKNKKYDVYKKVKDEYEYITSFGDKRYQHYEDKISNHYSHLNHYDKDRRKRYRQRHIKDNKDDPNYAGYWSWHYLW